MNPDLNLKWNFLLAKNNKVLGNRGEELAAEYLISNGYIIIEKNYRFHKGEIDIVAKEVSNNYIVFVEVKTRISLEYGEPEFAVNSSKKKQLEWLGQCYLLEKNLKNCDCRFDAIAITEMPGKEPEINHYINIIS